MIPNVGGRIINSTLQLKNNYNGGILFLLQSFPRYSYHLYSSPISSQFLEYRESQSSFISKLKDSIKSELYIRMPPADFGNDSKLFWSDRFPNVRYDTNSSFYTSMKSHRIIVSSSHSSVVSESLAANIPTVVLWDPACFELSEIAIPIYGLLLDAKIVHRTSLEAAAFINDIWDDIPSWWSTPSVQQARSEFCNEFASSTDNWAGQWKKNLSSVSV